MCGGGGITYNPPQQLSLSESLKSAMEAQGNPALNRMLFEAESNEEYGRPAYARLEQEVINQALYGKKHTVDKNGNIQRVVGSSVPADAKYTISNKQDIFDLILDKYSVDKYGNATIRGETLLKHRYNFDQATGEGYLDVISDFEKDLKNAEFDEPFRIPTIGEAYDAQYNLLDNELEFETEYVGKEKAGKEHYEGGGLVETMAGAQDHTFKDADGNEVTRKIGFDKNGQPMGLAGVARDLEQVDKAQRFASEISFMKDYGDDFTEAFREQGDIQGALDEVERLSQTESAIPERQLDSRGTIMTDMTQRINENAPGITSVYGQPAMSRDPLQPSAGDQFRNDFNTEQIDGKSVQTNYDSPASGEVQPFVKELNPGGSQSVDDQLAMRQNDLKTLEGNVAGIDSRIANINKYQQLERDIQAIDNQIVQSTRNRDFDFISELTKSKNQLQGQLQGLEFEMGDDYQVIKDGGSDAVQLMKSLEQERVDENSVLEQTKVMIGDLETEKAQIAESQPVNILQDPGVIDQLNGHDPVDIRKNKDSFEISDDQLLNYFNSLTPEQQQAGISTDDYRQAMRNKLARIESDNPEFRFQLSNATREKRERSELEQRQIDEAERLQNRTGGQTSGENPGQPEMSQGGRLTDQRGVDRVSAGRGADDISYSKVTDKASEDAEFSEIDAQDADFTYDADGKIRSVTAPQGTVRDTGFEGDVSKVSASGDVRDVTFNPNISSIEANGDVRDVTFNPNISSIEANRTVRDTGFEGDIRTASPNQIGDLGGLRSDLLATAKSDLALDGDLSARDRRLAEQSARIASTARGRARDTSSILLELENNERLRTQRRQERRAFASDIAGREGTFATTDAQLDLQADSLNINRDSTLIGYNLETSKLNQSTDLQQRAQDIGIATANQASELQQAEMGLRASTANQASDLQQVNMGLQADTANQASDLQQMQMGLQSSSANQQADLTQRGQDIDVGRLNQQADVAGRGFDIQGNEIKSRVAMSDADRAVRGQTAQAGIDQAEFQANQAGEMFNVTNATRQNELALQAGQINQAKELQLGSREFGASSANQAGQLQLTGMDQQSQMFQSGQNFQRDQMLLGSAGADLGRQVQTDQFNTQMEMSGLAQDRNFAVTRVGLETGTASDPLMAVSGRPSGAGTINTGALYAGGAQTSQIPQMFNPMTGVQFYADQNSNLNDYNIAYGNQQAQIQAGRQNMVGNILKGAFSFIPGMAQVSQMSNATNTIP